MEYKLNRMTEGAAAEEKYLNERAAEGWRLAEIVQGFRTDESYCDPIMILQRDKPPVKRITTEQDLVDRWISEVLATRINNAGKLTKVKTALVNERCKVLLDCVWQLMCSANLPGSDPRSPGGFEEHFNRIADRAKT